MYPLPARAVLLAFVLWSAMLPAAVAKSRSAAKSGPVDGDYVSALAAANRFLHAWQTQDQETGLLMLSDHSRQQTPEGKVEAFFTPAPHSQQAYEIRPGRKLADGQYTFPVSLLTSQDGHKWTHPHISQIEITRTGKNDWTVDKLP
jgi:hypothetical protein